MNMRRTMMMKWEKNSQMHPHGLRRFSMKFFLTVVYVCKHPRENSPENLDSIRLDKMGRPGSAFLTGRFQGWLVIPPPLSAI